MVKRKIGLSPRRQQWIKGRSGILTGETLFNNVSVSNRYVKRLNSLTAQMVRDTEIRIKRFYQSPVAKKYFAFDASISAEVDALTGEIEQKWEDIYNQVATPWASTMVANASKQSAKALSSSLEALSGGLTIKTNTISGAVAEVVKTAINQNVRLIKTIPSDYLGNIETIVNNTVSQPSQGSLQEMIDYIDDRLDAEATKIKNKAKNIALNESQKVYAELNAARMKSIGITEYRWKWRGGAKKPNEYHRHVLNGQIFRFDDPPIIDMRTETRGIPGQWFHCGCGMEPIISFDEKDDDSSN